MDPTKWFRFSPRTRSLYCVYCRRLANTSDHVPPRRFLPKRIPQGLQLMTVPACSMCNSSFQKDEQLAAAIISTVSFTPDNIGALAKDGWLTKAKVRDSRIRQFIASRMTADGYFQLDDLTIEVISKVAIKTAMGLLFYEYGRVVKRQDIVVLGIDHVKRIDPNAFIENFRIPFGWGAEVTPSGRQLERQVQAVFGISPKGATPWRVFLPEFFEYKFISGSNSKLLTGLKFHDAILVVLESPRPSSAGPNRTRRSLRLDDPDKI